MRVNGVDLRNVRQVDDAALARFDGLSHLLSLNLRGTGITGDAGQHIRLHASLDGLEVSDTSFGDAGVDQLAALNHLRSFSGGNTPVTDRGAQSLARIKSLRWVTLYSTPITDAAIGYLSKLPLERLSVEVTRVTDAAMKDLQSCQTLRYLSIRETALSDAGVALIAHLPLETLFLRDTRITDRSVETLAGMKSLTKLTLSDPPITQADYEKLKQALPRCDIEWSPSTKPAVAASAASAPKVPFNQALERKAAEWVFSVGGKVEIVVSGNKPALLDRADDLPAQSFAVSAVELGRGRLVNDQSLANLDGLSGLKRLTLWETEITSNAAAHIRLHPSLSSLNVADTVFGDAGIEQIAGVTPLVVFQANGTPISDRGAQGLARMKKLHNLYLFNTQITDAGATYLSELPLERLGLQGTRITDASLKQLVKCTRLQYLSLDRTAVGDAGIALVARLPVLRELELHETRITDRSVEVLGSMKSLAKLTLSDPPISQAACDKLRAALPGCKIGLSQTAATVPASAPASVVPLERSNRLAVPPDSERQKAADAVKEVFGDEIAHAKKPEDKQALAEKLLKKAQETRDEPASAYAMLEQAQSLAIDSADAPLLAKIVTELGSRFEVEPLELLAGDLEKANQKSHPSAAFKGVAETALEQVDDALAVDQFPLAKRLSDVALSAGRKAKDPAVLKSAIDRNKGMATIKQQWEAAEEAKAVLAKTPDDPDANLAVGRYLCFVKGDWPAGFAKLAKGSDGVLKDLGAKSAADPQDAAGQADLGEAWAKAADAARGKSKAELQAAARYWLAKALPAATGLAKAKIEQHMKQLGSAGGRTSSSRVSRRPAAGTLAQQLARDRAAAEWVLGLRGKVGIMAPYLAGEQTVELLSELPPQPFALVNVELFQNKQLNDAELKHLEGLTNLTKLRLEASPIGDAGLEHLKDLTSLQVLDLSTTQITDAGLVNLRGLTNLFSLSFGNRPPITSAGLESIKDLKNLTKLVLVNTRINDAGLAVLKNFPQLQILRLDFTPVTDAGLDRLAVLPQLTELYLGDTKITDAGLPKLYVHRNLKLLFFRNVKLSDAAIGKLQAALPQCKINF
ncbi:MAG TPA: hypothetical protein VIK18_16585 [Pirellulales bacterium]